MLISNDFQVANVLKRGFELYKQTFKVSLKYSLIAVLLTSFLSIYMYFLELIGRINEFAYAIGLVLLVILLVPLIYYSVRVVATTVGKFRSLGNGNTFNYRIKFNESKELFWRITLVLFLRLLLGFTIVSVCLLIFYSIISLTIFKSVVIVSIILLLTLVLLMSLLMLFRLEFAAPIIYWNIETEYSDIKLSSRITKHFKFKKLCVVLLSHLPNMLILICSLYTSKVYNGFIDIPLLGLASLVLTISLSTVAFSWMYSFYIALFEELGAFGTKPDDIEWLRF